MAKFGSASVTSYLADGNSLLGAAPKSLSFKVTSVMEQTQGLSDTTEKNVPIGFTRAELTQDGAFFDDTTATAMHGLMNASQATSRIVCVLVAGNTIGKPFFGIGGTYFSSYEAAPKVAALTKANAVTTISGSGEWGVILNALGAKTVDWNTKTDGSPVDSLASSANGGVAYMQVTAFSGFSGFVGTVNHSSDDSSYVSLVAFTNVTSGPTAQRVTVAGTVNRYLAFLGDVTGSGSITLMVGFCRLTATL
jgi:hypothetical protein